MCITLERNTKVTQHKYRSAMVRNIILRIDRVSLHDLEQKLADRANTRMDNHTVYEVESMGKKLYLQFTDNEVWLGLDIEIHPW